MSFPLDQQLSNAGHGRRLLQVWEHRSRSRPKAVSWFCQSLTCYQIFPIPIQNLKNIKCWKMFPSYKYSSSDHWGLTTNVSFVLF